MVKRRGLTCKGRSIRHTLLKFSLNKKVMQIKNFAGEVLHEIESDSLSGANLRGANLRRADLRGADLGEADLRGANLSEADLVGANLREANLVEANLVEADLRGADLREAELRMAELREADLREADLRRADLREAELRGANLSGANLRGADLPALAQIEKMQIRAAICEKVCVNPDALEMSRWHSCETVHCIAGWTVTLHPQGRLLESIYGPSAAAALILHVCEGEVPDFHADNETAMRWIKGEA